MMKKLCSLLMALLLLCTTIPAFASEDPRVDEINTALDGVMNGSYAFAAQTPEAAKPLAAGLDVLASITVKEIAVYAAERKLDQTQVLDAYYTALYNALDAHLMLVPASAGQYSAILEILSKQTVQPSDAAQPSAAAQPPAESAPSTKSGSSSTTTTRNRNTHNTPDRNTHNTPDRNTRNTPDTPDRNTRNSPDRNT